MNFKRTLYRLLIYLILTILAAATIVPFVIMFLGAFREHTDIILRGPLALPQVWDLKNFKTAILDFNFDLYTLNTLIITAPTVLISLFFATMASYALSFMKMVFQKTFTLLTTVVGVMIAAEFIMIPLYHLLNTMGLINTYWAAIFPQVAMSTAFATLIIRSFFQGLPKELVDSGLVDGASSWQILWHILVPLAKPAIITSGALTTVWTWNSYIIPLVMLPDQNKAPLPLGLVLFQGEHTANIPLTMAGTTITALPMLIFYFFFQRHIIKGLSQGAVD